MALEALLISRHEPTLRLLRSVLQGVEVACKDCGEPKDALDLLERQHFGAVIVDFDLPGGTELLKSTRLAAAHKKSVIFAVISRFSSTGSAFELGANLVLYKPLSEEQVRRAVRAARAFMRPERRRLIRHRLEALAYLSWDEIAPSPALVLDLNEGGVAVQTAQPLSTAGELNLRLPLPGTLIEAIGEVSWADMQGRAGIRFTDVAPRNTRELHKWLDGQRCEERKKPIVAAVRPMKLRAVAAKQGS